MRIDKVLVYMRFARTRSMACALITNGSMRKNGVHIFNSNESINVGDVLTWAVQGHVKIIKILELPKRREGAEIARSQYRELDRGVKNAIAKHKA